MIHSLLRQKRIDRKATLTRLDPPSLEVKKILFSGSFLKRFFLKIELVIKILRQGCFVKRLWKKDPTTPNISYFLSLPSQEKMTSYPVTLVDDDLFCGITHLFPSFKKGWTLLLRSKEKDSITVFCDGYLYYKRTLQVGADRMESLLETLRYLEKYKITTPRILYMAKDDWGLHHQTLKIQRIDASPEDILNLSEIQRDIPSFYPPLSTDYFLINVDYFTHLLIKHFALPLCAASFFGYLGIQWFYSMTPLDAQNHELMLLRRSLLPQDISKNMHLLQFQTYKPLSEAHTFLEGAPPPKKLTIQYATREITFEFEAAPKIKKNPPAHYQFTQKGRKITLKEKA